MTPGRSGPGDAADPGVAEDGLGPTVLVSHPSADMYGSDRMLLASVEGMREQGWDVVVTVPADGPLVSELEDRGVRVRLCPTPVLRKSAISLTGVAGLLAAVVTSVPAGLRLLRAERAQAVYVSTLTIPLWLVLARLARRPVVCHVHEAESSAPGILRRALVLPLLLADRLVVNSEFSRGVLTDSMPRLSRRAVVVYNGVAGPDRVIPPRRSVADGVLRLLYVGRLSPRKGPAVAVEALSLLVRQGVQARLELVGAVFPGYEWFERQLVDRAAELGVGDRVVFHGFQPVVWPFTAEADVVLVPSLVDEPFGNTAVEAVLAARPAVVSDTSGLREAAAGYEAVRLVPPGDATALACAVRELVGSWTDVADAAQRDCLEAARRHAPSRYRQEVAEQLSAVLEDPARATSQPRQRR